MDAEYQNPYWALSIEEAVAIRVGQGLTPNTLRFWKTKNAVIIGRFQCPKSEVSFNSCLRYGTAIVRRFTGGGAVYHDSGNLNFAVSIHLNPSLNIKPYNLSSKVGLAVISALKGFGISPAFDKMNIYVKNRKLSGMAGLVKKRLIFVHGSLLIDSDLKVLYQVLNSNTNKLQGKFVRSVMEKVANLKDEVNSKISSLDVKNNLINSFEKNFKSILILQDNLTEEEKQIAKTLYEEKYSQPQWFMATCRKCPVAKDCFLNTKLPTPLKREKREHQTKSFSLA